MLGQTTLFPHLFSPEWRPDITLALVLWVALTGTPRGGAILAFLSGLALDLVSGAPPGFSAILRLLVYVSARPFRGVFFENRPLLLVPFAALGAAADAAVRARIPTIWLRSRSTWSVNGVNGRTDRSHSPADRRQGRGDRRVEEVASGDVDVRRARQR